MTNKQNQKLKYCNVFFFIFDSRTDFITENL